MASRLVVIAAAVLAIAVAVAVSVAPSGHDNQNSGSSAAHAPKDALALQFVYSPEKEDLIAPLVKRFNREHVQVAGKAVYVEATVMASGDAEAKIAKGTLRPHVWSPASSAWGKLLNYAADRPLVADDNPSIVRSPLVIAMFKPLADAYGYPKRPLSYADLADLATGGWASVGKPQYGTFKFVHTNPDFSTAGLSEVAAQYYAAAGKKEGLTVADVNNPKVRAQVKALEKAIVHYGDTTVFISDEMAKGGMGYASAAATEESTVIDFNRKARNGQRLVAVYPKDGTFYSDSPFITLSAPWVDAAHKKAAAAFSAYLAEKVTPQVAGRYGFRPADENVEPAGYVTAANGVDPAQPTRVLKLPQPEVMAKIQAGWRADRKPSNVMLVLDNSGSMGEDDKLEQAKEGLRGFVKHASPNDRIGLTVFSGTVHEIVSIAPARTNRTKLLDALKMVQPESDTRVRDAAVDAVRSVEARLDRDAINAVVLLTDGEDTASSRSERQVIAALSPQARKETGQIRMFTIAYGDEPNERELAAYANATGGKAFTASTDDIEQVYRSISSFF